MTAPRPGRRRDVRARRPAGRPGGAEAADPGGMLRQVASSGAQVREARRTAAEAGVAARSPRTAGPGRSSSPAGRFGPGRRRRSPPSAASAAPCRSSTVRGYRLPGWVGAADLVIAVSSSGQTEETLAVAAEAARRGLPAPVRRRRGLAARDAGASRPRAVRPRAGGGAAARHAVGPLDPAAGRGAHTGPGARAGRGAGVDRGRAGGRRAPVPPGQRAVRQPGQADRARPRRRRADGVGPSPLAGDGGLPDCPQLERERRVPRRVRGELPEAVHNQLVAFDGHSPAARRADVGRRDGRLLPRPGGRAPSTGCTSCVMRDAEEHPRVAPGLARRPRRSPATRGVAVTEIPAEGEHPLERIAALIALRRLRHGLLGYRAGRGPDSGARRSGTQDEDFPETEC